MFLVSCRINRFKSNFLNFLIINYSCAREAGIPFPNEALASGTPRFQFFPYLLPLILSDFDENGVDWFFGEYGQND